MRRPYALTLGAFALPRAIGGSSIKRKMHFAGLGDGNIDHDAHTKQRLRGTTANRPKKKGRRRGVDQEDAIPSPLLRGETQDLRRAASISISDGRRDALSLDDPDLVDYIRK